MAGDLNYSAYNEHAERYVSHNIGGTTGVHKLIVTHLRLELL